MMDITRGTDMKTVDGPADNFTGTVFVDGVRNPDDDSAIGCAHVRFAPGARTAPGSDRPGCLTGLRRRLNALARQEFGQGHLLERLALVLLLLHGLHVDHVLGNPRFAGGHLVALLQHFLVPLHGVAEIANF